MKKLVALCAALMFGYSAQAQEFKPFKVNLSLGYAAPSGGGGLLFAIEPKYGINDQIDLGLRIEGAVMARSVIVNGNSGSGDVSAAGSYLLTGNYMLSNNNFRPFVGAGVGLFSVASASAITIDGDTYSSDIAAGNVFGGMIRAGFKTGHFVLGLEYNLVPGSDAILIDSDTGVRLGTTAQSKNSYLGVKLGFDIGGGRR